jgi:hypothetical protein
MDISFDERKTPAAMAVDPIDDPLCRVSATGRLPCAERAPRTCPLTLLG